MQQIILNTVNGWNFFRDTIQEEVYSYNINNNSIGAKGNTIEKINIDKISIIDSSPAYKITSGLVPPFSLSSSQYIYARREYVSYGRIISSVIDYWPIEEMYMQNMKYNFYMYYPIIPYTPLPNIKKHILLIAGYYFRYGRVYNNNPELALRTHKGYDHLLHARRILDQSNIPYEWKEKTSNKNYVLRPLDDELNSFLLNIFAEFKKLSNRLLYMSPKNIKTFLSTAIRVKERNEVFDSTYPLLAYQMLDLCLKAGVRGRIAPGDANGVALFIASKSKYATKKIIYGEQGVWHGINKIEKLDSDKVAHVYSASENYISQHGVLKTNGKLRTGA